MTTTKEALPITPGEWFIPTMGGPYHVPGTTASGEGDWCYYINSRTEQRFGPSSTHGNTAEEAKANAVLVADAGTTYNRTKVLPSVKAERLEEATRLLESCIGWDRQSDKEINAFLTRTKQPEE